MLIHNLCTIPIFYCSCLFELWGFACLSSYTPPNSGWTRWPPSAKLEGKKNIKLFVFFFFLTVSLLTAVQTQILVSLLMWWCEFKLINRFPRIYAKSLRYLKSFTHGPAYWTNRDGWDNAVWNNWDPLGNNYCAAKWALSNWGSPAWPPLWL